MVHLHLHVTRPPITKKKSRLWQQGSFAQASSKIPPWVKNVQCCVRRGLGGWGICRQNKPPRDGGPNDRSTHTTTTPPRVAWFRPTLVSFRPDLSRPRSANQLCATLQVRLPWGEHVDNSRTCLHGLWVRVRGSSWPTWPVVCIVIGRRGLGWATEYA